MDRRRFLSLSAFYTVAAATGTLAACHSATTTTAAIAAAAAPRRRRRAPLRSRKASRAAIRATSRRCSGRAASRTASNAAASPRRRADAAGVRRSRTSRNSSRACRLSAMPDLRLHGARQGHGPRREDDVLLPLRRGQRRQRDGHDAHRARRQRSDSATALRVVHLPGLERNHWEAMSLLAAETDLDFVVHLGDYIYETGRRAARRRRARASGDHAARRLPLQRRHLREYAGRLPHAVSHLPRRRAPADTCTRSVR